MSIEVTPEIIMLFAPQDIDIEKALDSAWNSCCDGQWLTDNFPDVEFGEDDGDPWDGKNEEIRIEIEFTAVQQAIESQLIEIRNRVQIINSLFKEE